MARWSKFHLCSLNGLGCSLAEKSDDYYDDDDDDDEKSDDYDDDDDDDERTEQNAGLAQSDYLILTMTSAVAQLRC